MTSGELVLDVLFNRFLLQLEPGSSDYTLVLQTRLGFQAEKESEQSKIGIDPQKSFTQMNKNSYMSYGVWIQMMDLESIEIEKATKKIGSREGQSCFDKMEKKNDFINIFLRKKVN
jgi:hypothetical protein